MLNAQFIWYLRTSLLLKSVDIGNDKEKDHVYLVIFDRKIKDMHIFLDVYFQDEINQLTTHYCGISFS